MKALSSMVAGLAAIASLIALGSASAKTAAECEQDYAAKKAAGETGGQSKASYVKACLTPERTSADLEPKGAASDPEGHDADTDLAKKTENPIADLISVPFNNYSTFNFGPHGESRGTYNVLEIQPVIPVHLTPDWNLITRTVLPIVWTPDLSPVPSVPVGTAPTDFSAVLTPKNEINGWLFGVGPIVQIPTISNRDLGSSVWGGGPTAVAVYTGDKIVGGALVNAIWSFGGTQGVNSYNTSLFEPFINYNFGHGWFAFSDPNIVANWQAKGTKWTVPLGGGAGRIVRIGKLPIKLLAGLFYNVVQPTYGGRWVLEGELTLIF